MTIARDYEWAEERLNQFGYVVEALPGVDSWALTLPGPNIGYLVFPNREKAVDFGMNHLERNVFSLSPSPVVLDHQIAVRVDQPLFAALEADAEANGRSISQTIRFLLKQAVS